MEVVKMVCAHSPVLSFKRWLVERRLGNSRRSRSPAMIRPLAFKSIQMAWSWAYSYSSNGVADGSFNGIFIPTFWLLAPIPNILGVFFLVPNRIFIDQIREGF